MASKWWRQDLNPLIQDSLAPSNNNSIPPYEELWNLLNKETIKTMKDKRNEMVEGSIDCRSLGNKEEQIL